MVSGAAALTRQRVYSLFSRLVLYPISQDEVAELAHFPTLAAELKTLPLNNPDEMAAIHQQIFGFEVLPFPDFSVFLGFAIIYEFALNSRILPQNRSKTPKINQNTSKSALSALPLYTNRMCIIY